MGSSTPATVLVLCWQAGGAGGRAVSADKASIGSEVLEKAARVLDPGFRPYASQAHWIMRILSFMQKKIQCE
jgi:hypothetical protein